MSGTFLVLLPCPRPVNRETRCRGKEYNFSESRPRRWQTNVSKKPSYRGLDASFFYRTERGGDEEVK